MVLEIGKCSFIYSSKAKECRYRVTEGVYGVFTERRSHKVRFSVVSMHLDILNSDKFVRSCLTHSQVCYVPIQPKARVIWLHTMNFIIASNVWVCHALVVCFGDDVMYKRNVYVSIRERRL